MGRKIILSESEFKKLISDIISEAVNSTDNNVAKIQTALKKLGKPYSDLLGASGPNKDGIDGIYGPRTKNAIVKFQEANGIKPTGFVGKITAPKLGVDPMTKEDVLNQNVKKSGDEKKQTDKKVKSGTTKISNKITNPDFLKGVSDTLRVVQPNVPTPKTFPAGQNECSMFVRQLMNLQKLGNAWVVHDNDQAGMRVWDAFSGLDKQTIDEIAKLYTDMYKQYRGANMAVENGPFLKRIKNLVRNIIAGKNVPPSVLKLDSIVGIFYPDSHHHQEAFAGGGNYFVKDASGKYTFDKQGKLIPDPKYLGKGQAWGMNTHLGVVAAIKDGIPIIYHNITGTVHGDPYNAIYGGGKIVWVKSPTK